MSSWKSRKISINLGLLTLCIFISSLSFCQKEVDTKTLGQVSDLFRTNTILPVQMSYSNRKLRKSTNDSTYININITYVAETDVLMTFPVEVRARGNFRREHCYFVPVKIKIKRDISKGTLFEGNKKLKLVLPCFKDKNANDDIIKEFLAYKLYETISPYHFNTRLLSLTLNEEKGKKTLEHKIKAFFIEDIEQLEERFGANEVKRNVHPLQQDALNSIRNAFFQFMIGNTDYSARHRHNQKILFVNGFSIPIPYDFDQSGLCNTSYSVVSQIGDSKLPIDEVTTRLYRGFKRPDADMQSVRNEFLDNKSKMIAIMENYKIYFKNPKKYEYAKDYILEFFNILQKSAIFKSKILDSAREE